MEQFLNTLIKEQSFLMVILYIVLGAFVVGAGAVAGANLTGTPRRR